MKPATSLIIIFVIVAPIAGAEIADGEEAEIMVVRHAVEEGCGAAVDHDAVAGGRPEIGAEQEIRAPPWSRITWAL